MKVSKITKTSSYNSKKRDGTPDRKGVPFRGILKDSLKESKDNGEKTRGRD